MQPLWGVGRSNDLGIMKQYAATQREQLYAELGAYLTCQSTSVRLVRLLSLLCDVKCYTTAYEDTYSLLGLFLPAEREAFWSNKPHVNDSQLAVLAYPPNDHNLP
ncbi:hypothetical protein M3Y99_01931700 [Aphelenchoides fujianensis]|nr:hypothetical protein M3Y99_01931700 [Aphelenchoides fujianensis]